MGSNRPTGSSSTSHTNRHTIDNMGKATFVIPDNLLLALKKRAPNGKQSEFVTRAIRQELLRLDVEAIAAAEAAAGGPDLSFEKAFEQDGYSDL